MASNTLVALFSQHQAHVLRLAAGFGNDVIPYINKIYTEINIVFAKYSSRKRLTPELESTIREEIRKIVSSNLQGYTRELKKNQREFAIYESEFSANELNKVVINEDFESSVPTAAQLTAAAIGTPIKISEDSYTTYNSMMRNYWQKWTDEIDAAVTQGFIAGQSISEIQNEVIETIKPSKTGLTKKTLDKARRQAKSIAITGTNHYANQARKVFATENNDIITGVIYVAVFDSNTSQQCRGLDGKVFKLNDSKLSSITPPLHPNCRSSLAYKVDERYTISDEDTFRASKFRVGGELDPKRLNTTNNYYEEMAKLKAADQDFILGKTLGKAFRKLDNPNEFAKLTVDTLGNPLTLTEIKSRDNKLSKILNNKP